MTGVGGALAAALAAETSGPDWAVQMTAWATLAAAVILGATALVAATQLGDARKTRHAQLVVDLSRRWDEVTKSSQLFAGYSRKDLLEIATEVYSESAQRSTVDEFITMLELPTLIETIGVLERGGGLALEVVSQIWGTPIIDAWGNWSSAVIMMRELTDKPEVYENFERVAKRLQKHRASPRTRWSWARR